MVTGLTTAARVLALMEWGDVDEVDAAISEAEMAGHAARGAPDLPAWQPVLWRAARALMEGRFLASERMARQALARGTEAGDGRAESLAGLLLAALCRDQERLVESESLLRGLIEAHPAVPGGTRALLALVLGEMGRDGQARQELSRLIPREPDPTGGKLGMYWVLADLAATVDAPADDRDRLARRLAPHDGDFAVEEGGSVVYGSVAFALARLAHARGDTGEAVRHYEHAIVAHQRVGAPLLLAHTQWHLASLLRTRGGEGDWDQAASLLAQAAVVYRRLGVEGRTVKAQAILARSEYGVLDGVYDGAPRLFRMEGGAWSIGPAPGPSTDAAATAAARLPDSQGLRHVARLLASPRRSLHSLDLRDGLQGLFDDAAIRHEYASRLAEIGGELAEAERAGDRLRAALARAEQDAVAVALEDVGDGDAVEHARRAVGMTVRIGIDRVEAADPAVGRHLRTSIRTGTFCSYEPEHPVRWLL